METLYYSTVSSPVGPLTIIVTAQQAVVRAEYGVSLPKLDGTTFVHSMDMIRPCLSELQEYFAGSRKQFTVPLDLRGTEFQRTCWKALLDIPYGETRSYAQMAQAVGRPNAFRAVGMANHDNPIAIIVPCHRVITSEGTLGGYAGGLDAKRWLLQLEGATWRLQTRHWCTNTRHANQQMLFL
jgi:methylated-DNA-[protein]-cysteine S-methyltransferase